MAVSQKRKNTVMKFPQARNGGDFRATNRRDIPASLHRRFAIRRKLLPNSLCKQTCLLRLHFNLRTELTGC